MLDISMAIALLLSNGDAVPARVNETEAAVYTAAFRAEIKHRREDSAHAAGCVGLAVLQGSQYVDAPPEVLGA
jgi:hypothetical protein